MCNCCELNFVISLISRFRKFHRPDERMAPEAEEHEVLRLLRLGLELPRLVCRHVAVRLRLVRQLVVALGHERDRVPVHASAKMRKATRKMMGRNPTSAPSRHCLGRSRSAPDSRSYCLCSFPLCLSVCIAIVVVVIVLVRFPPLARTPAHRRLACRPLGLGVARQALKT